MGTYTDFFVATDVEIRAAFSWLYPVTREPMEPTAPAPLVNPFTKKPIIDDTGLPKMSTPRTRRDVLHVPAGATNAVPTEEQLLRTTELPHLHWRNITPLEVAVLCEVMLGGRDWSRRIEPVLASADGVSGVARLPAELVTALSFLDEKNIERVGAAWLGHQDMIDEWNVDDGGEMVRQLSDLAKQATRDSKHIFLYL